MKSAHVIGIGGVGMSAAALLLRDQGYRVTGSDEAIYEPVKGLLEREGLTARRGYSPANIPDDVDLIVVGRNAKLDPETNDEVRRALSLGVAVRSFPEVVGDAAAGRHVVVCAGSYGKSTTSSMLAWILQSAGRAPGYFIGASANNFPRPAALGSGPTFVIEGDEYPTSHLDDRPKFLHYHPNDVLLTAVVHDHVNVYPTYESFRHAFALLLELLPADGLLVACADEPGAASLGAARAGTVGYGLTAGAWRGEDIAAGADGRTRFRLTHRGKQAARLETSSFGRHDIQNIVGASALALTRELVTPAELEAGVASFAGVRRRLDNVAPNASLPVFEGFGSSFEKARAAVDAVLTHFAGRPLVIAFEPHTFSWRNRAYLSSYDHVFAGAAHVLVAPPEEQGAGSHDQLRHEEILDRIGRTGLKTSPYEVSFVDGLKGDEVVLILTSGDLGGTIAELAARVTKRFPRR